MFDLARSVDLHIATNDRSHERVVEGRRSGLIELGDQLTWEARHLGIRQRLTVKVTALDKHSFFFDDVMIQGAFAMMQHRHVLRKVAKGVVMEDFFYFKAPYGVIGRLVEICFLEKYMRHFLERKANELKRVAETDDWKAYI
ncbi:cell division protein [Rubritalea spongiae]|uniref:Cell division protein n=1 Tax=Rubritalea spongiae TaxID=430797 RepID=A0ABW5E520_9BACT